MVICHPPSGGFFCKLSPGNNTINGQNVNALLRFHAWTNGKTPFILSGAPWHRSPALF